KRDWSSDVCSSDLIPGTRLAGSNDDCSSSAKKLSTSLFNVNLPICSTGTTSSGQSFVSSNTSKSYLNSSSSAINCTPNSYSGYAPFWTASIISRRWKSGSTPPIIFASLSNNE